MPSRILDRPARVALVDCSIEIDAARETCFRAFVDDVAEWFFEKEETKHTQPTRLEPRVGGRFFIDLGGGDANLLGIITMIKTPREIRMTGDCTIPQAFVGSATVRFDDREGGTRISVDQRLSGEFDDSLPAALDGGWMEGLRQLKRFVESARVGAAAKPR